jgi:hypothetical protein
MLSGSAQVSTANWAQQTKGDPAMKKTLIAISLLAVLPAGAVLADDNDCFAPRGQWQPRDAALQVAAQNGWTVREFEIDDGCYEIEGRDSDGRQIEVKLDPATLQIVKMEYYGVDSRSSRSLAPRDGQSSSVPRP